MGISIASAAGEDERCPDLKPEAIKIAEPSIRVIERVIWGAEVKAELFFLVFIFGVEFVVRSLILVAEFRTDVLKKTTISLFSVVRTSLSLAVTLRKEGQVSSRGRRLTNLARGVILRSPPDGVNTIFEGTQK
jgi:hypothetical protein